MGTIWRVLTRKKVLDPVSSEQSELGRVLNTVDLTALGVGSTLGVGVYVLVGHVAKDMAGPSVILSFLIATVASVFAGLCYAEFGARAPRAGSAYIYSYVCVGEFIAFVIGWNLILEYVIGSASVARGLSLYLDTLINNTLKDTFIDIAPIPNVSFMSSYFDFFAFGVSVLLAIALAFGLKESTWANNIFTLVNLLVVGFVVIAGSTKADGHNWHIDTSNMTNTTHAGSGGFFPFGVEGMIKGAATCFYGFVGFDCIATTGEEVKNPKRAIPLAIIVSLFIIFLSYFGTSTVVTLMVPYFDQDPNAPLPHAFETVGLNWAKWVVAIGGIFGLCASLFGAMFPLPRIIYAMASDSVIFQFLGRVSSRFKTPVVGTLFAGVFTGLMAALFELKQLVNMMSIGTLMAYTIVAASVLLLRYENEKGGPLVSSVSDSEESTTYTESEALETGGTTEEAELVPGEFTSANIFRQIFNCGRQHSPSEVSEKMVKAEVFLYCILCVLIGLCVRFLNEPIRKGEIWAIVLTAVVVALAILVVMSITTQPKSKKKLSFKVPLVPLIPALSILINIYLMLMLDSNTWIRFGVWMLIGIPTYYFSVKTHPDARNESIYSRNPSITANGKLNNGFASPNFAEEEDEIRKRPAPTPPTLKNIEATIADLDQMLENEEANDRKYSADSLSTASNVLCEENVQADVHCSDVPITPTKKIENLLFQSCDPDPLPSKIADFSSEEFANVEEPITAAEQMTDPEYVMDIDTNQAQSIEQIHEEHNDMEDKPIGAVTEQMIDDDSTNCQLVTETEPMKDIDDNDEDRHQSVAQIPKDNKTITERDESVSRDDVVIPPPPPLMMMMTEPMKDIDDNDEDRSRSAAQIPKDNNTIAKRDESVSRDDVVIPPPPPLIMELQKSVNARPQFHASSFTEVKLKPVQDRKPLNPAPVDNSPQTPTIRDKNIKFGTPEYREFREQLDHKLQQGYVPPAQVAIELKKEPIIPRVNMINEDVIEDSIDRSVAKEKLVQFLERTNSLPYFPQGRSGKSTDKRENAKETEPVDLSEFKDKHRHNMENIFRSVRLRKEDSFKQPQNGDREDGGPENDDRADEIVTTLPPQNNKENDDRLRHRENMDGIFKSIKLRKVDSLKNNESQ